MSEQTAELNERQQYGEIVADQDLTASQAAMEILKTYSREHPEVVAYWAFGVGFVLGWKLKLW